MLSIRRRQDFSPRNPITWSTFAVRSHTRPRQSMVRGEPCTCGLGVDDPTRPGVGVDFPLICCSIGTTASCPVQKAARLMQTGLLHPLGAYATRRRHQRRQQTRTFDPKCKCSRRFGKIFTCLAIYCPHRICIPPSSWRAYGHALHARGPRAFGTGVWIRGKLGAAGDGKAFFARGQAVFIRNPGQI